MFSRLNVFYAADSNVLISLHLSDADLFLRVVLKAAVPEFTVELLVVHFFDSFAHLIKALLSCLSIRTDTAVQLDGSGVFHALDYDRRGLPLRNFRRFQCKELSFVFKAWTAQRAVLAIDSRTV